MSDNTENSDESESTDVNLSRLREMAVKGRDYRENFEFEYYDETATIVLQPLVDDEFLPIAAILEDKLDMDVEEAQEAIEDEREAGEDDSIDPSNFDEEFVHTMQDAAVLGICTDEGAAEGEDEEGVREIVSMLQGGKSLLIAERVLEISQDAESAEKFRRDGGSE